VKDGYILTGKIDLIRGAGNSVEIVDFKTEKKPDLNEDREAIDRYRRQLEVYGHIVRERFGLEVSRLHLYFTQEESGNPYVSFPMHEDSVQETIRVFDGVVDHIAQRRFEIDKRPFNLCANCDMRHYCDGCGI
jgi:DNA helicase-2/ATP-dependent DNA helicase PcrA